MAPDSREYPTAEPQVTQIEFSKKSPAPHTSHRNARTMLHSPDVRGVAAVMFLLVIG
jgi:hypothetical protein